MYCDQEAQYLVGITHYSNRYTVDKIASEVCRQHVAQALDALASQCIATPLWPVVCNLRKIVVYHGYYDGKLRGYTSIIGWQKKMESNVGGTDDGR